MYLLICKFSTLCEVYIKFRTISCLIETQLKISDEYSLKNYATNKERVTEESYIITGLRYYKLFRLSC
jgi:hypothetical protein